MTESARLSYGGRRRVAMSVGKSGDQRRTDNEVIGELTVAAISSSELSVIFVTDCRTLATNIARAASSSCSPVLCISWVPPS